jgi:hypothetical protein
MVFNATFNNISVISWLSVYLVEKTRVQILIQIIFKIWIGLKRSIISWKITYFCDIQNSNQNYFTYWISLKLVPRSSKKTSCHNITETLLKVELNTIKPNQTKPIVSLKITEFLVCKILIKIILLTG